MKEPAWTALKIAGLILVVFAVCALILFYRMSHIG